MTAQHCTECGHLFAKDAKSCPGCGHRHGGGSRAAKGIAGTILALVLLGGGFVLFFPEYSPIELPTNQVSDTAKSMRTYVQDTLIPNTQEKGNKLIDDLNNMQSG